MKKIVYITSNDEIVENFLSTEIILLIMKRKQ